MEERGVVYSNEWVLAPTPMGKHELKEIGTWRETVSLFRGKMRLKKPSGE